MKKIFIAAWIFLLLTFIVYAQQIEPIYNSEHLVLDVELNNDIEIVPEKYDYNIESITAELSFIPLSTWRQELITIDTNPDAEMSEDKATFTWENPKQKELSFSLDARIKTKNAYSEVKSKIPFPLTSIPSEIAIYTQPTEKIDSNDPNIIKKANELAEGETDLFVVVHDLAEYVHRTIEYNLSTVNSQASLRASWVLENKEGVCDEISVLFIAMARALGIPARFISGISYTNSDLFAEKWGPHGWAEVYFPGHGWVPFDVTYDELGFIDASHITSKISNDPDQASAHYKWLGYHVNLEAGELEHNVELIDYGNKLDDFVRVTAVPLKRETEIGSHNVIEARIQNLKDYYVTTTVYIGETSDIEVIEQKTRPILLKPNEKKVLFWTVKESDELNDIYTYTFPIVVYTIRNESSRTEFTSKKGYPPYTYNDMKKLLGARALEEEKVYSTNLDLGCSPDNYEYYTGDEIGITCVAENKGNFELKNIELCLDEKCETFSLGISQKKDFLLVAQIEDLDPGRKEAILTAKNNEVSKTASVMYTLLDEPSINIKDLEYPLKTKYNTPFKLSFLLEKESFSDPEEVIVTLMHNGLPQEWTFENLPSDRKIIVNFAGNELSIKNNFEIKVEYKDRKGNVYTKETKFLIELENVTILQRLIIFSNDIARWIQKIMS